MFLCNHSLFWEFLLKIILIISKFCLICFYLCIYPSIIYLVTYINICFVGIRWQSRRVCALRLLQELQNYNLLMNNRWLENVSHQKKISHIQGQRRSLSKMLGGVKSLLESNPLPPRNAQRVQTKLVCTGNQEKGAETLEVIDPDLPMSVQESPGVVWIDGGLL